MRTKTLALTAALTAAGALTSMAQVYSVNIVGYINLTVPPKFSMIANQLNATPDNTLATVIPAPPENSTVYKFVTIPTPHFVGSNWSVDNPGPNPAGNWTVPTMTLAPGEGVFISIDPGNVPPSGATLTLVGEVQLVSNLPLGQGFSIISSVIPQSDTVDNLGFPAGENDTIYRFDPTINAGRGGYVGYNHSVDNVDPGHPTGWLPSIPTPNVGESFFLARQDASATAPWSRTFTVGP